VIQHVPYEGPALIADVAAARGVALDVIHPYRGDAIPREAPDALIVLGGPMGVYEADAHPHLRDEMALVRATVARGTPTLGICLGSQLLAAAHGADVRPSGGLELGFHDVTLTDHAADDLLFADAPRTFAPMHWHGDVFDLPRGAIALASSAMTPLQAYRLGARAWGLLFHLEVTPDWISACAPHAADPDALRSGAVASCAAVNATARAVLDRFFKLVDPGA
jgi:GMP synthase-like glutamine amidotransferase